MPAASSPFRPFRIPGAISVLGAALLAAACQPLDTRPGGGDDFPIDGQGGSFRSRNGWTVTFVPAANGAPAHCRGRREPVPSGIEMTVIAGEKRSGFVLRGLPPERGIPAQDEVVALFDDGERRNYPARREGTRGLRVMFLTRHYDDSLYPFARGEHVVLRGRSMGPLGTLDLDGSAWAINATDECRRISVPPE